MESSYCLPIDFFVHLCCIFDVQECSKLTNGPACVGVRSAAQSDCLRAHPMCLCERARVGHAAPKIENQYVVLNVDVVAGRHELMNVWETPARIQTLHTTRCI